MNELNTFEGTFRRLRRVSPIRTQRDIAQILGIREATVSENKKSNDFPPEWAEKICEKYNIGALDYILTGEGDCPEYLNGGIPKTFSARLRQARRRFGSLQDLANAVGSTVVTIQKWETNPPAKINSKLLQKIADVLGVSSRVLLFGADVHSADVNSRVQNNKIGERIDFAVRSADLSPGEFAEKSGIRYERTCVLRGPNSNPSPNELLTISKLTEVELEDLISGDIEIPKEPSKPSPEAVQREIRGLEERILFLKTCLERNEK